MPVSPKWGEVIRLLARVKPNLAGRLGAVKVASDEGGEVVVVPPPREAASLQRELVAEQALLEELIAQVYRDNKTVVLRPPEPVALGEGPEQPAASAPTPTPETDRDASLKRNLSTAQDLIRNKQYNRAAPLLQKVVDLDPLNVQARLGLADCLTKLERVHEAHSILLTGAEACLQAKHLEDAEVLAGRAARDGADQGELLLGLVAMERGDLRDAESILSNLLARAPSHPGVLLHLARCFARQGKLPKALELYQDLVRRHPGDMDATSELAETLSQMGKKTQAADWFLRVANFYARQVQLDRAVAFAKRALTEEPGNVEAHQQLISSYHFQGRKEELLAEYRALLSAYGDQGLVDEAARVRKKIDELTREREAAPEPVPSPPPLPAVTPTLTPPAFAEASAGGPPSSEQQAAAVAPPEAPGVAQAPLSIPELIPPPAVSFAPPAPSVPAEPTAEPAPSVPTPPEPAPAPSAVSKWESPTPEPTADELLTDFARLFRETKRLRRLREIDEIKSAALSTIVDEVKRMLGWSKSLFAAESGRMEELPPETQEIFYSIASKSPVLERLCDDLVQFNNLVDEEYELPPQSADVVAIAAAEIEHVRPLATVKKIQLEFVAGVPALTLPCDGEKVGQVLRHLLGNSVKFTPSGGTVGIEVRDFPAHGEFTVRDTGQAVTVDPGSIFLRFRGISNSLSGKIKGRGIRMPILQSIIEAHGGRLVIQGEAGVGNRFTFTLPKTRPARPKAPPTEGGAA